MPSNWLVTTLAELDELLARTRDSDPDISGPATEDLQTFINTVPLHPRNIMRELLIERAQYKARAAVRKAA
jgi:hypothetical protein